jgi:hypothetical protein
VKFAADAKRARMCPIANGGATSQVLCSCWKLSARRSAAPQEEERWRNQWDP